MNKVRPYNFRELFSPLDLLTVSYIFISGVYLCFNHVDLYELLPHLFMRIFILMLIVCLALAYKKWYPQRLIKFVKDLYPLLFLGFFYTETSFMKNIIFSNNFDQWFYNLEQILWHCQPSLQFSRIMNNPWFNELMNICYFSYYPLIGCACILIYFRNPNHAAKAVFTIVCSFYLYYVIFALFPVVGPQFFVNETSPEVIQPYFFGKIMQSIIDNFEQPTGAFPSSHVGIAIIVCYVAFRSFKGLFFLVLPFVIGICFATVYLKAHYVIDVIAGILSVPIFIALSGSLYNKFLSLTSNKNSAIN